MRSSAEARFPRNPGKKGSLCIDVVKFVAAQRSTLDATPVAPLRPPLKGAAARLAALGPAGLPLTAELRFAGWQ